MMLGMDIVILINEEDNEIFMLNCLMEEILEEERDADLTVRG